MPVASVIIPTHNRCASLRRTLDALCNQTATAGSTPAPQFDVHVVADGCVDGTVEMLQHYQAPFSLHVAQQGRSTEGTGMGAAAARNRGAKQAQGSLLIFLDDDVEPLPALVAEHVRAHQNGGERSSHDVVVLGPYPPTYRQAGFLEMRLSAWWQSVFDAAARPGHRFTYKDMLGGNFSIDSHLFAQLGGFHEHPALYNHQDYEFGIRLVKAGISFTAVPAAMARHHEVADLKRVVWRKKNEGVADVFLSKQHPDISETLPFVRPWLTGIGPHTTALLKRFAFAPSAVRRTLVDLLRNSLHLLERVSLRDEWNRVFALLQAYAYWCGVAESLVSHRALSQRLRDIKKQRAAAPARLPYDLDLSHGLASAERRLDEERPLAAQLRLGSRVVGLIPAQPGAEPLRGAHLRPLLATTFAPAFREALSREGEAHSFFASDHVSQ